MKQFLNFALARKPKLYTNILKVKGNYNLEKIVFLNLVKNGETVIDIGANRGYYTLLFSHLVGNSGQVHAFEPVPPTFKKLSQTIDNQARYKNWQLNQKAVGNSQETITIYMPGNDDGQASMTTHQSASWSRSESITKYECEMITLDDYAHSNLNQGLDFIKCDVEGAELLALKGAIKTIKTYLPLIYLEVCNDWTKNFDYTPSDLVKFLQSIGYNKFWLISNRVNLLEHPQEQLKPENFTESANLLCTISTHHQDRVSLTSCTPVEK